MHTFAHTPPWQRAFYNQAVAEHTAILDGMLEEGATTTELYTYYQIAATNLRVLDLELYSIQPDPRFRNKQRTTEPY